MILLRFSWRLAIQIFGRDTTLLCPDFILGTPHRIYTHSMIKNINIPAGAGSPKSRKSSADIGKPAPPGPDNYSDRT